MRRFRFRLDRLLALRRGELDQQRLALARETGEHERLEEQSRILERSALRRGDAERSALAIGADGVTTRSIVAARAVSWSAWNAHAARLAESGSRVARKRQRVREGWQRVRSLERLRERRSAEHARHDARHSQRELDQVGKRMRDPSGESRP